MPSRGGHVFVEVVDHEVGSRVEEILCSGSAIDTDNEAEGARVRRGDPGGGVLEDDGVRRRGAEVRGGGQEHVGSRFAGEALGGGGHPVDHHGEVVADAGRLEHPDGVLGAGDDAHGHSRGGAADARGRASRDRAGCPSWRSTSVKTSFLRLPIPQTVSAVVGSVGAAERHRDAAGGEQARDSVVALLAVEILEVVLVDVGLLDALLGEELGEHGLPGEHVDLGSGRQHPVEIEEHQRVGTEIGLHGADSNGFRLKAISARALGLTGNRTRVRPSANLRRQERARPRRRRSRAHRRRESGLSDECRGPSLPCR